MKMTEHARMRCAQRWIDEEQFSFIKKHGRRIRRTGIIFFFLGRRDIPPELRANDRFTKLEGVTLLVSSDGELITAYRNPRGLKTILKKTKHRDPEKGRSRLQNHSGIKWLIGHSEYTYAM